MSNRDLEIRLRRISDDGPSADVVARRLTAMRLRRHRSRQLAAVASVAATVVVVLGAVWWNTGPAALTVSPVAPQRQTATVSSDLRDRATCFATVDLNDPTNRISIAFGQKEGLPDQPVGTQTFTMDQLVEVCAMKWAQQSLQHDKPYLRSENVNRPQDFPVPDLTSCVLADGGLGVFPGSPETCSLLGIPTAVPW